jgi:hypothetical protein
MIAYGFTAAFVSIIILVCANILFFSDGEVAPDMDDSYDPEDVPEGNGYDSDDSLDYNLVFNFIGIGAAAFFVAKVFVMKKTSAKPVKAGEDETLMMYSSNNMA